MDAEKLKQIVEAALLAADEPLTLDKLVKLFRPDEVDETAIREQVRDALRALAEETRGRGVELSRVASGFRFQVRQQLSPWISRLWEEKPPRYTRALLETLALVAYRQPVTRGDIEEVRGVSVSQSIMRTLLERGWIRVVGQREVPGRPAMYGTTRAFLDYFDLKSLDQLPPLAEIRALIEPVVLEEPLPAQAGVGASSGPEEADAAEAEEVAEASHGETPEPAAADDERPARVVEVITDVDEGLDTSLPDLADTSNVARLSDTAAPAGVSEEAHMEGPGAQASGEAEPSAGTTRAGDPVAAVNTAQDGGAGSDQAPASDDAKRAFVEPLTSEESTAEVEAGDAKPSHGAEVVRLPTPRR